MVSMLKQKMMAVLAVGMLVVFSASNVLALQAPRGKAEGRDVAGEIKAAQIRAVFQKINDGLQGGGGGEKTLLQTDGGVAEALKVLAPGSTVLDALSREERSQAYVDVLWVVVAGDKKLQTEETENTLKELLKKE